MYWITHIIPEYSLKEIKEIIKNLIIFLKYKFYTNQHACLVRRHG